MSYKCERYAKERSIMLKRIIRFPFLLVLVLFTFPALTGSAVQANSFPILKVDSGNIAFGETVVGNESDNISLVLTNDVSATLVLSIWSVRIEGADAAQFAITRDNASNSCVDNGMSKTLDIKFKPLRTGMITANLVIETNTGEEVTVSNLVVPLTGFGVYGVANGPFENGADKPVSAQKVEEQIIVAQPAEISENISGSNNNPEISRIKRAWIPVSAVLILFCASITLLVLKKRRLHQ